MKLLAKVLALLCAASVLAETHHNLRTNQIPPTLSDGTQDIVSICETLRNIRHWSHFQGDLGRILTFHKRETCHDPQWWSSSIQVRHIAISSELLSDVRQKPGSKSAPGYTPEDQVNLTFLDLSSFMPKVHDRAAGFNTVSFYTFWGLHEYDRGEVSFDGLLDLQPFFDAAKEAGIYLIARPGFNYYFSLLLKSDGCPVQAIY